jgi:hypothetical protein
MTWKNDLKLRAEPDQAMTRDQYLRFVDRNGFVPTWPPIRQRRQRPLQAESPTPTIADTAVPVA